MKIECPSCKAAYDVSPERLSAGRGVKCVRCATTWTPVPIPASQPEPETGTIVPLQTVPDPAIAPAAEPVQAGLTPERPAQAVATAEPLVEATSLLHPASIASVPLVPPPLWHHPQAILLGAWLLTLAVLAGLGWAAVARRADIMQAWPPSMRAYAAIGLTPTH